MPNPIQTAPATAVALALAMATPMAPARAQTAGQDTTRLDQIIVTGTRARDRTVLDSTAPIDVLTAEDLRAAGVLNGELGTALQALLPSFNFPRQSNSSGADHIRAAQLRGLSPDQVLVLVNGKRRHTSALVITGSKTGRGTTPVDFNAIPVSAIQRIEVLRDGAGAQYGSDAIAGVINVILDEGADGGELELSYGAHHTRLAPIDRRLTDGQTLFAAAKTGTAFGDGGRVRFGVELKERSGTNRAGFDQIPPWDQTDANLAVQGQRNYHMGDGDSTDLNAWVNGAVATGAESELYFFGTFNQRDSDGANYYRYPEGAANWPELYPDGYRPVSDGDNRDLAAALGQAGRWGAWHYDLSANYGGNRFTYRLRDSLNPSLGPGSPTRFRIGDYAFDQTLANLDLTRDLDLGAGAFTFALGGEYRHENFRTGAGDPASYAAGPFVDRPIGAQAGGGLTPQDTANLSRDVFGFYTGLSGELTERMSTDLAVRYERYSDAGSELTGKLAARYAFTPAFALRGALSNNVRAPSLSQIGFESTGSGYGADGQLVQSRLLSVNNPIARALGAEALVPETSNNASLGVTFRPSANFDVSLDLFRIEIDDRVVLSERIAGDALTDFVDDNFGVPGVEAVNFFTNAVDTRTEGAELVANYALPLAGGDLAITGAYSYARNEITRIAPTPDVLLALGADNVLVGVEESNTLTDAAPRTRALASATWSTPRWSLLGRISRHGSTTRVFNFGGGFEPSQTYGAEWQLDAEVEYRATDRLALAVGGLNLTDEYPDLSNEDIFYFGNLPYDVLSPVGSNGAYWYARIRYAF